MQRLLRSSAGVLVALVLAIAWIAWPSTAGAAPLPADEADKLRQLVAGDGDERYEALAALAAGGNAALAPILSALRDGEIRVLDGKRILKVDGDGAVDVVTGETLAQMPAEVEEPVVNNRMRGEIGIALSALRLGSPDPQVRLEAVQGLGSDAEESLLPLVSKALAAERDPKVKAELEQVVAAIEIRAEDPKRRVAAAQRLAGSGSPSVRTLIASRLEKNGDEFVEPESEVRIALRESLESIERRLAIGERIGQVFSGISLGSVLLLAALGLAITYGLMGVINMAHGELMMIGAYATWLTQNFFRQSLPSYFDWYVLAAIPVSFLVAALVGAVLERGVIRFLYGRPLETLLATWGISLILMQAVRTLFGAQNVAVENPSWLSGGIQAAENLVLPYNRIAIIAFSVLIVVLVWAMLSRSRLGIYVRAVTQNRSMAGCVGVPTANVDTLTFALGSGIAGLAGCALSQIGNVGPDLGQSYIVDSFLVVVVGGVGQLAGTVIAALGLGIFGKFLEGFSGAVLAKIAVLVFIILFIQKRPQGLFALRGRFVES